MIRYVVPACLIAVFCTAPVSAAPAKIPDKNLEKVLRAALFDKKETDPITDEELRTKIFILHADDKGISDLTGLEHCKNLRELRLARNKITSVEPLKALTLLQSLDLANNQIGDVGPLAGLTKLQFLELSGNRITKLDPIGKITELRALYIDDNQISDIKPLVGLKNLKWSLSLGGNKLKDISPLAQLPKISNLDLHGNEISDISALKEQTEMRILQLQGNKVSDLSPLVTSCQADVAKEKRFAPYLRFYLFDNPLSEVARKDQLPALEKCGVQAFKENLEK